MIDGDFQGREGHQGPSGIPIGSVEVRPGFKTGNGCNASFFLRPGCDGPIIQIWALKTLMSSFAKKDEGDLNIH